MMTRTLAVLGILTAIFISSFTTSTVSGQGAAAPPLVITAYNNGPAIPYTMPKTPWGEPDLQGVWSSDDTQGIPMQRPQNVTGLYQGDEQWAARQKQTQQGIQNALNAIGTFRGDYARRAFRQTSLIVDPADGRQPAITPAAEKRRASRDRGTFGDGPFNTPEDFTLYDRCITRGIVGSVLRVVYGNGNRIVQAPGMVAISYEMVHDTRVLYTDGRPHINQAIRQYLGDSRARWVGDELVVETTNLTDKTSIGPLRQFVQNNPIYATPYIIADIDPLLADTHAFEELRLLSQLRSRATTLNDDEMASLRRIIGGSGTDAASRLGLQPDIPYDGPRAAFAAAQRWRRRADHPLNDPFTTRACRAAVRSAEAMVAEYASRGR